MSQEHVERTPSFLNDRRLKFLLFGGKGGVGKTTTAAATALYRASRELEQRVLIVSTDPAHSLADSFDWPIGDEIKPVMELPNLFAWEMDASRQLENFKRQHGETLKTIADRGTYFDEDDINQFFDLSLPGLDELMAVIEVADIVRERQYDLLILDTAPTGHTVRLLGLPQQMEQWIRVLDLMLEKHRYMMSVFGRYRPDETDALLERMSTDLGRLRGLLRNAEATEFVPVTIPEAMSIEETARLLESLEDLAVPVRAMVVNRVAIGSGCPFCEARRREQEPYLKEIRDRFPAQNLTFVSLMPREVQGRGALEEYAQALMDGEVQPCLSKPSSSFQALSVPRLENRRTKQGIGGTPVLAQQQLILFAGKGGVGKTTTAAATAVHLGLRDGGKRILLFSTDPAHSLSDSLEQKIGNQITPIAVWRGSLRWR